MKSIYATKKLQNSELYKELQNNLKSYFSLSLEKENKQKSYLKKLDVRNTKTGEIFQLDYDFEREYKKYNKLIEQKSSAIEHIAREFEYTSIFLTFTLPSKFHPFKSRQRKDGKRLYVSLNEDFAFNSIGEAIDDGYIFLNELIRTFYKRVKNYVADEFFYIKVFEPHTTTTPHLHYVCFFPYEYLDAVRGVYKRVIEHYELNQVDFEECRFRENIQSATRYLLKYVTKNLADSQDYFLIRSLDGWKKQHKIAVVTSSQLDLSHFIYKKIYYALTPDIKAKMDEIVKEKGIPYYIYLQENCYIKKFITYLDSKKVKTTRESFGNASALFKVELKINRIRSPDSKNLSYRIKELIIKYKKMLLYKKSQFVTVQTV